MRIAFSIGAIFLSMILLASNGMGYPQPAPGDPGAGLDESFFGEAMGFVHSLSDDEKLSLVSESSPGRDRIRRAASHFFPNRELTAEQQKGWEVRCLTSDIYRLVELSTS